MPRKYERRRATAVGSTKRFETIAGSVVSKRLQRMAWRKRLGSFGAASPCRTIVSDGRALTVEGAAALAAASAHLGAP